MILCSTKDFADNIKWTNDLVGDGRFLTYMERIWREIAYDDKNVIVPGKDEQWLSN